MNDHEFEEWVKRADYNHDALIAEVTRLQQARADDTVLLGTVAAERDAAITRAERAGQALALAEQSIASATGGVYCTQCGDQLVTDGDDNLCWVCVGTLKSRVEAAEREVASEAKRADAMSRSALANYDQVVALNVALATAERERDEARANAEAALARAQAERDSLLAAVDVAIADREYFHAEEQRVVAALQRVATVIGEIVIPSPLAHRYYVDNVIYVHDRSTITGAEIKARVPDYGPGWSLYRHGKGNDPDVLVQDTDVMVLSGERLMLAALPPAIGGGSSDAQPPALPPLPEGWTRDDERYVTHVVFERIGRDEEVLVDGDGADVSAVSVDLADLITVLRHAEAAHQRLRQDGE